MESIKPISKGALWTGRILSGLCIAFLLMDAIMKVIKSDTSVKGSVEVGWPEQDIQPIGFVLLFSTLLYLIPRTAILGAVLLTGYLGGASAVMVRAGSDGHPFIFPIVFGILVWGGLFLRDQTLRSLFPLKQK
jgi:hypothetical protein